ncbi:MAG: NAD-dependent epimerase/dehydratase family protein [Candidatus Ancaeobacter aquaticus]|nr:NAD-dependent epimerase/dehydratase family protein [Candidatus Ancaeobacter aquaticus]
MILVTGATGYIGSHLVLSLRQDGQSVLCLVRKNTPQESIDFLKSHGAEIIQGDLLNLDPLIDQVQGKVKKVVHLVGSIVASKQESFETVHKKKTKALISLCQKIGAKKIVLLTAVGASPDAESDYLKTKFMAEEEVRNSGIPYVVLRASLVFGNDGGMRNSKMLIKLSRLVQRTPFVPFIGTGQSLVQPVYIGDLIICLKKSVLDDTVKDKTFEIAGPEKMSFNQMIQKIADYYDVRRIIVHIPTTIMIPIATLLEKIIPAPAVSCDQIKLLKKDNVCDTKLMEETFPVNMIKFEDGFKI